MYTSTPYRFNNLPWLYLMGQLGLSCRQPLAIKSRSETTVIYTTKSGYYVKAVNLPNGCTKKYYYRQMDKRNGALLEFLFTRTIEGQPGDIASNAPRKRLGVDK